MTNQMTLAEALIGLQKIKDKIELHEMANDMYYSSAQHVEDEQELKFWQKRVKEWAPSQQAWQRQITINGKLAIKRFAEFMETIDDE